MPTLQCERRTTHPRHPPLFVESPPMIGAQFALGSTTETNRPRNSTWPSFNAKSVWSRPRPTLWPGVWHAFAVLGVSMRRRAVTGAVYHESIRPAAIWSEE